MLNHIMKIIENTVYITCKNTLTKVNIFAWNENEFMVTIRFFKGTVYITILKE